MFRTTRTLTTLSACLVVVCAGAAEPDDRFLDRFEQVVFGCHCEDDLAFREFAAAAQRRGATHVTITAEDLPIAYWELTPPGDPYPAWVITNPGLLKIASPEALRPYIPQAHGEQVMRILEARCKVLRELGLKAAFHTFEPQMLPERVFEDHPDWRGPRVDHPLRSRTPRYAPCISHPEVLQLYTEAMGNILRRAPEIELIQMRTNDSGSGLGWSSRLYAGTDGNPRYRSLGMEHRIYGFFKALRYAADARDAELYINMYNVRDERTANIVATLDAGMAVDDLEGPDGAPFKSDVGSLLYYRRPFAPAAGIPWAVTFLEDLAKANAGPAKRLFVSIGDRHNQELYLDIFERFARRPSSSAEAQAALLREVAAQRVGQEHAADLVHIWRTLQAVEKRIPLVSAGGTVFILGCVQQRWLTRPFVPPGSLTPAQKWYYRRFQFQARTEAHADDLMDLQATRIPEHRGGYETCLNHLAGMKADITESIDAVERLRPKLAAEAADRCGLLSRRLQVFGCLVDNATGAFNYQRLLDEAGKEGTAPSRELPEPVRMRLAQVAQGEIENIRRLIAILNSESDDRLLDRAEEPQQEYQRLLGPNLIEQLKQKISIMQQHQPRLREGPATGA